jgi:hypothetical protein
MSTSTARAESRVPTLATNRTWAVDRLPADWIVHSDRTTRI